MLLRRLWSDALVDFTGTWHHIDRAALAPRPGREFRSGLGAFPNRHFAGLHASAMGFSFSRIPNRLSAHSSTILSGWVAIVPPSELTLQLALCLMIADRGRRISSAVFS